MDKDKGYKQGWLSAYFGIIPRSRQNQKGHEARAAWLSEHFGGLEVIPSGSQYLAVLPQAYEMDVTEKSYHDFMNGRRLEITPLLIEIKADSLAESVGRLHRYVLSTASESGIDVFRPKQGQAPNITISGKKYFCIHQEDELHDHSNPDLLDFVTVEVSPVLQRVSRQRFEDRHTHLLNTKFAI